MNTDQKSICMCVCHTMNVMWFGPACMGCCDMRDMRYLKDVGGKREIDIDAYNQALYDYLCPPRKKKRRKKIY